MTIPVDWTSLNTELATYFHRADQTEISTYIRFGERRLAQDLRIEPLIAATNISIAAGTSAANLPSDYVEIVDARIANGAALIRIAANTLPAALNNANSVDVPVYYTTRGNQLCVAPAWAVGGAVTVNYYQRPAYLSASNATNWYITEAPEILLYACQLEGALFNRDTENAQAYKVAYEYARDQLNQRRAAK